MKQAVKLDNSKDIDQTHKTGVASRRALFLVWLGSLAILSLSAILYTQPGYMDAYYYHHVAQNVAAGRGLVEDYVWNYLPAPETVSHPSNLYWMPLTSLVIVPFFEFLGNSFRVAQIPFILLASLLTLFTFWLGMRLSGNRRHALASATLTLFSGFYFAYWTSPDSFALFALTANAVLLLGYGLLVADKFSPGVRLNLAALAGSFAALSHLARADGVLLLAVAILMIGMGEWRSRRRLRDGAEVSCHSEPESVGGRDGGPHPDPDTVQLKDLCGDGRGRRGLNRRLHRFGDFADLFVRKRHHALPIGHKNQRNLRNLINLRFRLRNSCQLREGVRPPTTPVTLAIAACLIAYVLVMSPWFVRNWQLVGSVLPTAGVKTLFLQEYNDFYAYGKDLSWQSFLAWGAWPIVRSKLEALGSNVLVLFGMEYHLVPFALLGLWHLRRKAALIPFFAYAGALYLVMSLIFTFPSGRGSMLHSSVVLLPWLSIAAVAGLDYAVVLAARRLRHWNVPLAQRNFTLVLVFFAIIFSAFLLVQEAGKRNERYRSYNEVAAWFEGQASQALIMIADPPGYFYSSGKSSIVIPSDDLDTILAAARRYGASYLVLEQVHSRPLHPLYTGDESDPRLEKAAELGLSQIYRMMER